MHSKTAIILLERPQIIAYGNLQAFVSLQNRVLRGQQAFFQGGTDLSRLNMSHPGRAPIELLKFRICANHFSSLRIHLKSSVGLVTTTQLVSKTENFPKSSASLHRLSFFCWFVLEFGSFSVRRPPASPSPLCFPGPCWEPSGLALWAAPWGPRLSQTGKRVNGYGFDVKNERTGDKTKQNIRASVFAETAWTKCIPTQVRQWRTKQRRKYVLSFGHTNPFLLLLNTRFRPELLFELTAFFLRLELLTDLWNLPYILSSWTATIHHRKLKSKNNWMQHTTNHSKNHQKHKKHWHL